MPFELSPEAWESGTKEGEQGVSSISCLWLLTVRDSSLCLEAFAPLSIQSPARTVAAEAQFITDPKMWWDQLALSTWNFIPRNAVSFCSLSCFCSVVSGSEREKMPGMPERCLSTQHGKRQSFSWAPLPWNCLSYWKQWTRLVLTVRSPVFSAAHFRAVAGSWGRGVVIAGWVGPTCLQLHNADGSVPHSRRVKPQLTQRENRQSRLSRGSTIRNGLSKGADLDWSQAPTPLLKNPPLLRFEKRFIAVCWICVGPVVVVTARSETRGKDALRS